MEIFRLEEFSGRLLSAEPDERSRYNFIIWFPYTRELVNEIEDGDLLAVPNFQSNKERPVYSILKVVNVLPKHFALRGREDTKSYPGYVLEAAKNIAASWIIQENEPLEDTTIIEIEAIPTNLQFRVNAENDLIIEEDRSMPMVGEEAKLLSPTFVMKILNRNIKFGFEEIIEIGHLIRDEEIKIYVRVEDLIRTHFGIFGYTGVGKSNLLSTIIRKLLTEKVEIVENQPKKELKERENVKILLFDLMDEYTGLLVDLLVNENLDSKIIYIDRKSLPKPVVDYLKGEESLEKAVNAFLRQMYVPKGLLDCKDKYYKRIKWIFEKNKIRIWEEEFEAKTIDELIEKIWPKMISGLKSPKKILALEGVKKDILSDIASKELTVESIDKVLSKLGRGTVFGDSRPKSIIDLQKDQDLWERVEKIFVPFLEEMKRRFEEKLPEHSHIRINDILKELHYNKKGGLYIFVASDPNKLREFAYKLGYKLYDTRRRFGLTYPRYPLILFVFDEADEFIPLNPPDESYKLSKSIIETITRRGRKFGIGVGLATQRSVYLDTNIMGQLHTYFISKLPRKSDRERVAEAFGLPESEFVQTFKFRKGEWLLVSHDATGIESVPIPIYVENAEEAIRKFLSCDKEVYL